MRRTAFAAIVLAATATGAQATDQLTFVADQWMPFNGAPGEDREGYVVEILRAALAENGQAVRYETMTWKRALDVTRRGQADAVIGAEVSDAPDFIFPQEEVGRYRTTFFTRADNDWRFTMKDSLTGQQIGVVREYSYPDWLNAYRQSHADQFDVVFGDEPLLTNLRKLLAGRIDVVPSNPYSLGWLAQQKGLGDQIRKAGLIPGDTDAVIHAAFSPANPESRVRAEALSKAIRSMRADGRLQAILSRYGIDDWRPLPSAPIDGRPAG